MFLFVSANKTQLSPQPPTLGLDFLLHEVEAHGQQGETNHDVQIAQHKLFLIFLGLEIGSGDKIAEANRRQSDKAEVSPIEERPILTEDMGEFQEFQDKRVSIE